MRINFLVGNLEYFNSYAFIYPVYNSINALSKQNNITISYKPEKSIQDLIFVDSKYFYKDFTKNNFKKIATSLSQIKKRCKLLIYCDNEASLFINKNIYEYVDFYLKSKLPKNKNYYFLKYYGLREYTDFYNKKFNIRDGLENFSDILSEEQIQKNILGWNNGICDYSLYSNLKKKIFSLTKLNFLLQFKVPKIQKKRKLSARIEQNYNRETINFQRKFIIEKLKNSIETSRIGKKDYFREISNSFSSLSPFGWGEICYRDFEIFLNKSMLVKPSMEHLATWPNYYVNKETYLMFNWDLNNFENVINILDDKEYCLNIAENGHNYFMSFFNNDGKEKFSNYFENILNKILKY